MQNGAGERYSVKERDLEKKREREERQNWRKIEGKVEEEIEVEADKGAKETTTWRVLCKERRGTEGGTIVSARVPAVMQVVKEMPSHLQTQVNRTTRMTRANLNTKREKKETESDKES